jgi:hypothetical protein
LPDELAAYVDGPWPTRPSGRVEKADRTNSIIGAVERVIAAFPDINATRDQEGSRRELRPVSGCSIVAEVLEELKYNMSERAVQELWVKRKR